MSEICVVYSVKADRFHCEYFNIKDAPHSSRVATEKIPMNFCTWAQDRQASCQELAKAFGITALEIRIRIFLFWHATRKQLIAASDSALIWNSLKQLPIITDDEWDQRFVVCPQEKKNYSVYYFAKKF